jgi:hypothetical protein
MKLILSWIPAACILLTLNATAGIKVHPHWVNVNTQGATTVFLTFGGVVGYVPGEAVWCGEIMDASPDIGSKPVPGTIFGALPERLNLSTFSGSGRFTDIMSIPPSVSRRAYQAAAAGARSTFFYVRRFISTTGGPDEYVAVTCELAGGGARTPFGLTNVGLAFEGNDNLPSVNEGGTPPPVSALITYTGTGQLRGRWEIVRPGDEPPTERDLLTEATLPVEQRGQQRRYTQLARFSVFLPPTGTFTLRGPDPALLPTNVRGLYMILLRIEASTDVESISDLAAAGAGQGSVAAGGVAGFPIPPLRYFVGGMGQLRANVINLLSPGDMTTTSPTSPTDLSWTGIPEGSFYRVVVIDPSNTIVLTALLTRGVGAYRLPPWIWTKSQASHLSWSVEALDDNGDIVSKSEWRTLMRESERQEQ